MTMCDYFPRYKTEPMSTGDRSPLPEPIQVPQPAYLSPPPWECPRCGRVNAWWVSTCPCGPKTTTGSSTEFGMMHLSSSPLAKPGVFLSASPAQGADDGG
jgi:hypothetical protein